jgi:hypothetical protein
MVPNRAREFIQTQNTNFDKKTNKRVPNKVQRNNMLDVKDYDEDGLDDIIVTKDDKIYSVNRVVSKDTDYPLIQAYINQGFKNENKIGESVNDGYSMNKLRKHHYNVLEPRKGYYTLNADFSEHLNIVACHYPSI